MIFRGDREIRPDSPCKATHVRSSFRPVQTFPALRNRNITSLLCLVYTFIIHINTDNMGSRLIIGMRRLEVIRSE